MIDTVRTTQRNVKHWSSGEMGLRWTAAGMLEAEKQFRKVIGYTELPRLAVAIEQRLHLPHPTPPRPRRPPSQSLCNDHTGTVVTEVPRRTGQPPYGASWRSAALIDDRLSAVEARVMDPCAACLGYVGPRRRLHTAPDQSHDLAVQGRNGENCSGRNDCHQIRPPSGVTSITLL